MQGYYYYTDTSKKTTTKIIVFVFFVLQDLREVSTARGMNHGS